MKQLLVLSFIFSSSLLFAQLKQKMADQHFQRLEYSKCVEMYDELAAKCAKDKKSCLAENIRRAAVCHFKLYEMDKAEVYFNQLKGKENLNESDREMLIKSYRYQSKYDQALDLLRESHNLFPQNVFFKSQYERRDDFALLYADSSLYKIKDAGINSDEGEFGASFYPNSLVFSTKSKNTGFINERYAWDGDFFLNLMQVPFVDDTTFGKPALLKHQFISRAHDGPLSITEDGNFMVITRNSVQKQKGISIRRLGLYFSTKGSDGEWSDFTPFEYNDPNFDVGHGFLSVDGKSLYFVSNQPGGYGGTDIYRSFRQGNTWSKPENLGDRINTNVNEMFPYYEDGSLIFASEGHFGLGGLDIFETNPDQPTYIHNFGYPINTAFDDFNLIVDSTGNRGFLSSNRSDFVDRIYRFKRNPIKADFKGKVLAQYKELEALPNQLVYIKNMSTNLLDSIYTDEEANFETKLDLNKEYRIYTTKDEFLSLNEIALSTLNLKKDSTFTGELILKPTTIIVHLRVVEKKSRNNIPMANVTLTDYETAWDTTLVTNAEGLVSLTVDRNVLYWAHGSKKGFIDTDISFNTRNEDGKIIDLELALPPIKKGEKFKLENIFYDLNKSTLRPESKSALDKLADFIIKNDLKIELSAHTDARGSNTYNQKLSQARAQSCVDYLISRGVKPNRILAKGYGETMLINKCKDGVQCSEEEHQENRRTEVRILEVN